MRRCTSRPGAVVAALALLGAGACGQEGTAPRRDGGASSDAAPRADDAALPPGPDGGSDGGSPVVERAPCALDRCWLSAPSLTGACGVRSIPEDFSTGRYDAHRVVLTAPAGVQVELTLRATGGSFEPALLLLDPDGTTLYDGERARGGGGLEIVSVASGRSEAAAVVRVTALAETILHVLVTGWSVVDAGFASRMPMDARYTLTASVACPPADMVCPIAPQSITRFGSGFFRITDSDDPTSPSYNPYKRDTRMLHEGYDIYAPRGTAVVATQSGTVVSAVTTDDPGDLCGISVNLGADSGVTFRYCHLDRVDVTSGRVVAGQQLGVSGQTGNALSPHLHFVYLDAPAVTGIGSTYRSDAVNRYVDSLCL